MSSKGVYINDLKKFNKPIESELQNRNIKMIRSSSCKKLYMVNAGLILNKNTSLSRINRRCHYTGRKKGIIRTTKMTRMHFKKESFRGYIPGIRKSSW